MRGFLLSMDAMVAVGVLLMLAAFLSAISLSMSSSETQYQRSYYIGKDILNVMKNTRIVDVWDYPIIQYYRSEGFIDEENKNHTILDIVGHFWSSGNETIAANIIDEIIGILVGNRTSFQIVIDNDIVYTKGTNGTSQLSKLDAIASGFSKGQVTSGYSTKAFLTEMAKSASEYVYFGGFEGEGNLTKKITLRSLDTVIDAVIEADMETPFNVTINNQSSGNYIPTVGEKRSDRFVICNSTYQPIFCQSFIEGENTIMLNFSSDNISGNYVGGGLLRVTYTSTEPLLNSQTNGYKFPGINGFLNLYSSFSVPGNLKGMNIKLHFDNEYDTYLRIGNATVYNNSGGYTEINLTNETLYERVNYSDFSNNTVPLRFGTEAKDIVAGGNADVVLITDVSNSMEYMLNDSVPGISRECDDPSINNYTTDRLSLAKCLDIEFIRHILNFTGNRVGVIAYSGVPSYIGARNVVTIRKTSRGLTESEGSLVNQIEAFTAKGATGICGSLRKARLLLDDQSDSSRMKFIVVMSDGMANVQCDPDPDNENITRGCINYICPWYWMETCYGREDCLYSTCGEYASDLASQDAVDDACKASERQNATIYSIGFGPVTACSLSNQTLESIAECGNGTFYSGTDAISLRNVYMNISHLITTLTYQAQEVDIVDIETDNTLYPDSEITLNYESYEPEPGYGELTFNLESPTFGGIPSSPQEGYFYVFDNSTILDANLLSYSSEHWTDYAAINNTYLGDWNNFYNLDNFGADYEFLGDPFSVHVPSSLVSLGNNTLRINTGTSPSESKGGSPDDKAVFSISRRSFVGYGPVFPKSSGSTRTIWFDINQDGIPDGSTDLKIGEGTDDWDPEYDSLDDALLRLLDELNFFNDQGEDDGSFANPVDVNIIGVRFDSGSMTRVPGMWGPVKMEIRVWSE